MSIRIYGGVGGSRAFRNIWMLEELGLPYENIPVDFRTEQVRDPSYLALNPNGRVPTLVDGDLVLWESLAINLYLARRYGGALQPDTPDGEAHTLKWSMWAVADIDGPQDAALRQGSTIGVAELMRAFRILNDALTGRGFLVGDTFTVADLNVSPVVGRPTLPRIPLEPFPELARWVAECLSRPACGRAMSIVTSTAPRTPGL